MLCQLHSYIQSERCLLSLPLSQVQNQRKACVASVFFFFFLVPLKHLASLTVRFLELGFYCMNSLAIHMFDCPVDHGDNLRNMRKIKGGMFILYVN